MSRTEVSAEIHRGLAELGFVQGSGMVQGKQILRFGMYPVGWGLYDPAFA